MKVNLACGNCYTKDWLNLDYNPSSPDVKSADLLGQLPIPDNTASVVYSSHFLEHIPIDMTRSFLAECYRILKPDGIIRLVLPDWEELCETYLMLRKSGAHDKADFVQMEMLDQCVRMKQGGMLADFYRNLEHSSNNPQDMIEFVFERTGHIIQNTSPPPPHSRIIKAIKNPKKLVNYLRIIYIKAVLSLLPSTFVRQNVSLASVGERHAWMYDFFTVSSLLKEVGFTNVRKMTFATSCIPDFPFYPLDMTKDGQPRKGKESMYVEATKP